MTDTRIIDLTIPYAFRELFEPHRYKVYYGGRGGAKSWAFADALLILAHKHPLRILCARELQVSIAESVHHLLAQRIVTLGLDWFYEIQKTAIFGANGSEFIFKGLKHNSQEIKSTEGIDICWVEEAQKVSGESWELLVPTVRKRGSEIWLSFNPRNPTDATWKRFVLHPPANAIVRKVSWRDNPYFKETELQAERLALLAQDKEAYEHVWEGEFDTRYSGSVYAKWMERLRLQDRLNERVVHDPAYPVYTLWDLGYGDATVVWFYQCSRTEVLLIDYYENNGEGVGHYCDMLKGKDYLYHAHYVPQDAGKKLMEAGGRSIVEQAWKDHGIRMTVIPETTHANRNAGLRKILPHCWFNSSLCGDGIEALMFYHYKYNEDLQTFRKEPEHDWSSHACTALELLPSVWHGRAVTTEQLKDQRIEREFFRKRRENRLEEHDPYRIKPGRKRR